MMLQRIWNQDPQRRPMSAPPIGSSETDFLDFDVDSNVDSEELNARAEPDYPAYYYDHVKVNPRIPPPINPKLLEVCLSLT